MGSLRDYVSEAGLLRRGFGWFRLCSKETEAANVQISDTDCNLRPNL